MQDLESGNMWYDANILKLHFKGMATLKKCDKYELKIFFFVNGYKMCNKTFVVSKWNTLQNISGVWGDYLWKQ